MISSFASFVATGSAIIAAAYYSHQEGAATNTQEENVNKKIIEEEKQKEKYLTGLEKFSLHTYCQCHRGNIDTNYTGVIFQNGKGSWSHSNELLRSAITYEDVDSSYIVSQNGTIAILESAEVLASPYVVDHCSLTHKAPVLFAGEYQASDGVITYLNRVSGHYESGRKALQVALEILELYGIDTTKIKTD